MLKQIYKLGKLEIYKTYKEKQLQEHRLIDWFWVCLLYPFPSQRDRNRHRMRSSA